MKLSEFKQLIKQSILEEKEKEKNTSGAMTPEEEKMVADYEREQDAKHALDKEQPLEEEMHIPDDIKWQVDDVVGRVDDYDYELTLVGHSPSTGKRYTANTTGTKIGGGDFDWSDVEDIEEYPEESIEEIIKRTDMVIESWNSKKQLTEEMHGGYLELLEMNPAFEEGVANLLQAWNEWKKGPMTEPYMVEEAKQDVLAYLSSMMK